eukprot:g10617.t1
MKKFLVAMAPASVPAFKLQQAEKLIGGLSDMMKKSEIRPQHKELGKYVRVGDDSRKESNKLTFSFRDRVGAAPTEAGCDDRRPRRYYCRSGRDDRRPRRCYCRSGCDDRRPRRYYCHCRCDYRR